LLFIYGDDRDNNSMVLDYVNR